LLTPAGGSCHGRGFAAERQNLAPVPPTGLTLRPSHIVSAKQEELEEKAATTTRPNSGAHPAAWFSYMS